MFKSRKVKKAEKLRLLANEADKKLGNKINSWSNSTRKDRDKYYEPQVKKLDKIADAHYKDYYNYVHSNFSKEEIKKANKNNNQFMSKRFTNNLNRK